MNKFLRDYEQEQSRKLTRHTEIQMLIAEEKAKELNHKLRDWECKSRPVEGVATFETVCVKCGMEVSVIARVSDLNVSLSGRALEERCSGAIQTKPDKLGTISASYHYTGGGHND